MRITDDQIRLLLSDAEQHAELTIVKLCEIALYGYDFAKNKYGRQHGLWINCQVKARLKCAEALINRKSLLQ